jgi:hypothetical protein
MAGIVLPVMIHLWNNKQGKVLSIGSIAFLDKTSLRKARSRKVSEWLLLLLRCLLLILLALLLSGPYWDKQAGVTKTGWVLVGAEPAAEESRAILDSLVKKGFEKHVLPEGNWWNSISLLDRQAPAGVPFYIFGECRLRHFSGPRPRTNRPIKWYITGGNDSMVQWTDRTWLVGQDSVGVLTGSSRSTGTTYQYRQVSRGEEPSADTSTLRVAIYADGPDGQWVAAAVRALQQFTRRRVEVSVEKAIQGHPDWVFWLSSQPVPRIPGTTAVLFYEQGKEIPVDTWVSGSDIAIEKEVPFSTGALEPVWLDGFGRPLLGLEDTEAGRRYHFFSHFDPAWNGLVWSAELPLYMERLLLGKEGKATQDRRMIDPQQVILAPGEPENHLSVVKKEAAFDLAPAGWVIIWILLLAERLLSFKKQYNNG